MKVRLFFCMTAAMLVSPLLAMDNKDKMKLSPLLRKLSSPRFEKASNIETVHGVCIPKFSSEPLSPSILTRNRSDSRSKFKVQEEDVACNMVEVDSPVESYEKIDKKKLFLNLDFKKDSQ